MLTTLLDLLGLACLVAALLLVGVLLAGLLGLVVALVVVAVMSFGGSWLLDLVRAARARK